MTSTQTRVFELQCIGCGSSLEISIGMNQFACKFCGLVQVVEHKKGTINLRAFSDILTMAAPASDATDIESTGARLENDLQIAHNKLFQKQRHWKAIRTERLEQWKTKLKRAERTVKLSVRGALAGSVIPSWLIAVTVFGICKKLIATEIAMVLAVAAFAAVCAGTAWIVRELLRASDNYGVEKLQTNCKHEFARMDARIAGEVHKLENRIVALDSQLKEAKEAANYARLAAKLDKTSPSQHLPANNVTKLRAVA